MAAYLIGGNRIHSGLHININWNTLVPLSVSVLITLQVKYVNLEMIFLDEISMVGYSLFKKLKQCLHEIMGSSYPFDGLHIVTIGEFY